ncbi:DUF4834 family protein [Mucilaginibacter pedocola]|uniref:DUF4834 domain-containing protein n=1 Tax=Mucilaginibacter pedocola TaxID=1792845 RepID=A0A1S9PC47_9SPHI|nr:DUF4834 family protein [Mucilaginibacter pedocola]OOQ58566.1 hypothetical protein BC343_07825 [Mucilaginibacter pedocola]
MLRYLIIIICILYIVQYVFKLLLPAIFRAVINNVQQNAQQNAQQQYYKQQQPKPDGRVKVDYIPEGKKQRLPDSEGEFVDYEEIK